MLELKNVKKIYKTKSGDVGALNGISLTLPEHGLVFISGKSGCGKTTLLNVIGGLDGIDDGEISLFGKSFDTFSQADYDSYRNTFIGFIFQEYNLLSEFTIEKNIEIAMELQGRKTDKAELDALLKEIGIEDLKNRKPMELSGGQRQRVAIARALVKQPRIIMADEPTGALDSKTGIQVLELLKKLSKNKLIIIVSHDDELAEKYADRIIKLIDGKVDSDVTYSENVMKSNVSESDTTLLVKAGSDLTEDEKDTVAKAIKKSKKIELISNLSHRSVKPTEDKDIKKATGDVQLKKSKMKGKSALALGFKSMTVKPVRLIITILLSVVAFAMFGLFDTVANFNTQAVVNEQMRKYKTVAVSSDYILDWENNDVYGVKLSGEKLKEIEKQIGTKLLGVYDLADNTEGSPTCLDYIQDVALYSVEKGENYYNRVINGYVEFSKSDFSPKDGKESKFGFKLLPGGRYPSLITGDSADELYGLNDAALSTYMAESILHYLGNNEINGAKIEKIEDLVGKTLKIGQEEFNIVGLIDCGEIPQKYDPLKEVKKLPDEGEMRNLYDSFSTFISSSAYRCLFVADGRLDAIKRQDNKPVVYYSGNSKWEVSFSGTTQGEKTSGSYLYSSRGYDADDVVLFSGAYPENSENFLLQDNEILVHVGNLKAIYSAEIGKLDKVGSDAVDVLLKEIASTELSRSAKDAKLTEFFEKIGLSENNRVKKVNVSKMSTASQQTITKKDLSIIGFYDDIGAAQPTNNTIRFMMNDKLLSDFGVYTEQGDYLRFIFKPGAGGSSKIAKYMVSESGLAFNWYGNYTITLIRYNETVVRQGADLFLYISLALAVFSVFMLFNYIVTSIVNKRPTIGVLRGLGSGGKDILKIFLCESILIALINAVVASIVTAVGCIFVNNYIINVMQIPIPFALFGIRQLLMIFGLSIGTAIVSCILPIIRIAKQKPVDLIRTI